MPGPDGHDPASGTMPALRHEGASPAGEPARPFEMSVVRQPVVADNFNRLGAASLAVFLFG